MQDIQPRVHAIFDTGVPVGEAMVAVQPDSLGDRIVIGHHETGVAGGVQRLQRMRREGADTAKGSAMLAMIGRPHGLTGILDHL